ncbi:MAG: glutathione S-transferase family protein [Erythrobacter sp.]
MELIGMPLSPFVKKCELLLREKELEFSYRQISPLIDQDQYFEHSPLGKMPILLDGEIALPDSSAIAVYLDGIAPSPKVIPDDPVQRAWVVWLEEYSDSVLLSLSSGLFFARFIGPRLMGLPVDEDGANIILTEKMPPAFDYLETQFHHGSEYLCDCGYSLADIAVSAQLCMFKLAGGTIDASRWPRLAAWFDRVNARPAFQACVAEEERFFDIWLNTDTYLPKDGPAAAAQLGR